MTYLNPEDLGAALHELNSCFGGRDWYTRKYETYVTFINDDDDVSFDVDIRDDGYHYDGERFDSLQDATRRYCEVHG